MADLAKIQKDLLKFNLKIEFYVRCPETSGISASEQGLKENDLTKLDKSDSY